MEGGCWRKEVACTDEREGWPETNCWNLIWLLHLPPESWSPMKRWKMESGQLRYCWWHWTNLYPHPLAWALKHKPRLVLIMLVLSRSYFEVLHTLLVLDLCTHEIMKPQSQDVAHWFLSYSYLPDPLEDDCLKAPDDKGKQCIITAPVYIVYEDTITTTQKVEEKVGPGNCERQSLSCHRWNMQCWDF